MSISPYNTFSLSNLKLWNFHETDGYSHEELNIENPENSLQQSFKKLSIPHHKFVLSLLKA
jgi:hypothetical protein